MAMPFYANSAESVDTRFERYPSQCPICGRGGEPGPFPTRLQDQMDVEPLVTLRQISEALDVPVFTVRRAAKRKEFPTYRFGSGRLRARLSEVNAALNGSLGAE